MAEPAGRSQGPKHLIRNVARPAESLVQGGAALESRAKASPFLFSDGNFFWLHLYFFELAFFEILFSLAAAWRVAALARGWVTRAENAKWMWIMSFLESPRLARRPHSPAPREGFWKGFNFSLSFFWSTRVDNADAAASLARVEVTRVVNGDVKN